MLLESLILPALGFQPRLSVSEEVFLIAHKATLLQVQMSPARAQVVYVLMCGMRIFFGVLSTRRVKKAAAAEIF